VTRTRPLVERRRGGETVLQLVTRVVPWRPRGGQTYPVDIVIGLVRTSCRRCPWCRWTCGVRAHRVGAGSRTVVMRSPCVPAVIDVSVRDRGLQSNGGGLFSSCRADEVTKRAPAPSNSYQEFLSPIASSTLVCLILCGWLPRVSVIRLGAELTSLASLQTVEPQPVVNVVIRGKTVYSRRERPARP
jgi:hypothetical protein